MARVIAVSRGTTTRSFIMKSKFRSIAVIALMACAFASSAVHAVVDPIVAAFAKAKQFVVRIVLGALALSARTKDAHPVAVLAVRFHAFWLRMAKREQPVITGSWRMCPSV
jgi:hypothetical protein